MGYTAGITACIMSFNRWQKLIAPSTRNAVAVSSLVSVITLRSVPERFRPADATLEVVLMAPLRKPEVMSPAGYWPQLRAAIEAGADAVYFGLKHFTARAKVGFTPEELPEALRTLHQRGVKGYVTFNTLVFEDEWDEAARALEQIARAGADAIIVQDLGVLRMARQIAPDLEIH